MCGRQTDPPYGDSYSNRDAAAAQHLNAMALAPRVELRLDAFIEPFRGRVVEARYNQPKPPDGGAGPGDQP